MPHHRVAKFVAAASCGVVAAATVSVVVVMGTTSALTTSRAPFTPSAACALPAVPAPVSADGGMTVTVRVPVTVVLQVEWNGELIAAMTNTGCAPRGDEDIFLMWPDRTITECTTLDAAAVQWEGTFTQPGVYEPQSGGYVCS